MAIDPSARYPTQVDTSDPTGYPNGAAQNVSVPGDGTGTPWEKDLVDDLLGFQQALLDADGASPSGTPDKVGASQYLDAVRTVADQQISARLTPSKTFQIPGAHGLPNDPDWIMTDNGEWFSPSPPNEESVRFPVDLPNGAVITAVQAIVDPVTARLSGSNMDIRLIERSYDWAATLAGSTTTHGPWEDDETAALQAIGLSGLSITVDSEQSDYIIVVKAGSGGVGSDVIMAVRVIYTPPDPVP